MSCVSRVILLSLISDACMCMSVCKTVGASTGGWQLNLGGKYPIRKLTRPSTAGAVNSSSARGGAYEPHPFKYWHLVGLILYRSCAHNHVCCEFSSVTALLCPEDPVSQPSSLSSDFCNLPASCTAKFPEPWEEGEGGSLGHRSMYGWALGKQLVLTSGESLH